MTSEGTTVWEKATKGISAISYEHIDYATDKRGLSVLTFKRPEVLNSFSANMKAEVSHAINTRFRYSPDERALVITGDGDYAFSSGEDLSEINPEWGRNETVDYTRRTLKAYHEIILGILCTDKPIIAAINGLAFGAGLSIAIACDYRFGVRSRNIDRCLTVDNNLMPGFSNLGLIPDSGITMTLPRLIGDTQAGAWFEPKFQISIQEATVKRVVRVSASSIADMTERVQNFFYETVLSGSGIEYAALKTLRNKELVSRLTRKGGVFDWELQSQTACMLSDFTRQKIRRYIKKSKNT